MAKTPDPTEPESETERKRKPLCESPALTLCCPFVAVLCCFARGFQQCVDAMKPDTPKAG